MRSLLTGIARCLRFVVSAIVAAFRWGCRDLARDASLGRQTLGLVKLVVLVLVLLAVGGAVVAASGVMPIGASGGHWPITAWFLKSSMSRSVKTHSLGIEPPPLDDPRLVLLGAGHYETACRACHGSPSLRHPRVAAAMTPHPPYLPPRVETWDPEELFYIVKHGVKFTGMPAWPAKHRDDEIWAMTAFLLEFPKLDEVEYRRLVFGETMSEQRTAAPDEDAPIRAMLGPDAAPRAVLDNCGRCHGIDGHGRGLGAFPKLAGQQADYLKSALEAYSAGDRPSGVMEPIAAALDPDTIQELATYYSELDATGRNDGDETSGANSAHADEQQAAIERGKIIAHKGIPDQRIPACVECHGPHEESRHPAYPSLAGQYAPYLVSQLKLFKSGHRGDSEYAHLMNHVAPHLTEAQMRVVAAYYASLADPSGNAP